MKILVTSLPDLKKINVQRPHHLLKHLSQSHDVTVVCVNAWWLEESTDEIMRESLENLAFHYMDMGRKNTISQEILIKKSLKKLNIDPDSFDVLLNFNSLIAGYKVARSSRTPMVFDVCDDLVDWINVSSKVPGPLKPAGKKICSVMLQKNIKISRKITFSLKSLEESFNAPSEKSVIVPNGVDTETFKNMKNPGHGKKFIIGFVGFLGNWVDIETPFKALKELEDVEMIVVGGGDNLNHFKNMAEKLGVAEHVKFTGDVHYSQVPVYISQMDVCLLSFDSSVVSHSALPLKLFEYMACERPVVSSSLESVKEAVGDRVLYADTVEDMKNSIETLCNNEDLRIKLGNRGRTFVKENYSWNSICSKFEEVLKGVSDKDQVNLGKSQ
ncbi:glycosyltransferase family 4 protein [Methanobacterium aggregans]|uniref:glycosyltransferase family 4 protein n=1 Tax=Methanobacterium aggregans TaxID=1615586 RepID=UPI001AE1C8A2|nr:glycosyltransferase family 4 protein [Methanobacterium aggregans]MBP2044974.1 glycosyltransferase involved in cell wall biosynthesis [Methanobacterium aggregans]